MADVILIGASVRALATSARRAGDDPLCVDLFRDADLVAHHPDAIHCPLDQYPHGFPAILETLPPLPVIYGGGFENYPDVIEAISRRHHLWGNPAGVLRRVRDPFVLADRYAQCHERFPRVTRHHPGGNPARWLKKRYASSAGRGVTHTTPTDVAGPEHYFQVRVPGRPLSGAYFSDGTAFRIGVSEQLIGCDWLNAKPYWYCGNVGPLSITDTVLRDMDFIARVAAESFNVRGCFGIDVILNGKFVHLIEINPRYTASNELYERYWPDWAILRSHKVGFFGGITKYKPLPLRDECLGKAIWHTPFPCRATYHPEDLPQDTYADLPHHGQAFGANEPFVTMFAMALDRDGVVEKLKLMAGDIPKRFQLEPI